MLKNTLKLFMLIIIMLLCAPAFSQERIIDNAGLLNSTQKNSLNSRINSISAKYNFDLVIVTQKVNDSGVSIIDYAEDLFLSGGFGAGQDKSGCLFLQVTGERDYCVNTSGKADKILNNYAFNKLENDLLIHLGSNNYYEAYNSFLTNWEEFLNLYAAGGRSYNFFYKWNVVLVIIAWVIAFLTGLIVVASWKGGMNTAIAKTQAAAYVVPGSLSFKVKTDNFLYSTVTKTARPTEVSSGSGGRTVSSSSGRTSGRSGKY